MKDKIAEFIPEEKSCSYLGNTPSLFRYFQIDNCSPRMYQLLLERGWRRFGRYFFVPICRECERCISIRYLIGDYALSKSTRRILNKNQNTRLTIQRPTVSLEHLKLYDKYHRHMQEKKQWDYNGVNLQLYFEMFVEGHEEFGFEFLYYHHDILIGIGLVDVLPQSISAVYFFYDPDFEHLSPGVYSILKQMELGKKLTIPHLYPGYWIEEHHSMGYKERYKPFEFLEGRPDLDEAAVWKLWKKESDVC